MSTAATASDTLAHEQELIDLPLIYRLNMRGTSQWKAKKVQNKKSPDINCPKRFDIAVRSKWNAGGRRGEVNIQYVPGAPTCFVNDYVDIDGKVQPGLKKLGYDLEGEDYRRAVSEGIAFINGVLYLENYGGYNNRVLVEFVHLHSTHEGAPNFKRSMKLNSIMTFKALIMEKEAAKPLETLEDDVEAANLFGSLRKKSGDKFSFDMPKLDAIVSIFNEGGGLGAEDGNQKMASILPFYKKSPVNFLKAYKSVTEKADGVIKVATQLNILTIGSKEAKAKIGTATNTIFTFTKGTKTENIEELIFHFMTTGAGQNNFNEVIAEIEKKKIETLSSK